MLTNTTFDFNNLLVNVEILKSCTEKKKKNIYIYTAQKNKGNTKITHHRSE